MPWESQNTWPLSCRMNVNTCSRIASHLFGFIFRTLSTCSYTKNDDWRVHAFQHPIQTNTILLYTIQRTRAFRYENISFKFCILEVPELIEISQRAQTEFRIMALHKSNVPVDRSDRSFDPQIFDTLKLWRHNFLRKIFLTLTMHWPVDSVPRCEESNSQPAPSTAQRFWNSFNHCKLAWKSTRNSWPKARAFSITDDAETDVFDRRHLANQSNNLDSMKSTSSRWDCSNFSSSFFRFDWIEAMVDLEVPYIWLNWIWVYLWLSKSSKIFFLASKSSRLLRRLAILHQFTIQFFWRYSRTSTHRMNKTENGN